MIYKKSCGVVYCFIGFILIFFSSVGLAKQFELRRDDGSYIHFYIRYSKLSHQDSLLILLQGSDCNSVDNNISLNTDLPQIWPHTDVLTVEKYGLTNSLPYSKGDNRADGCPAEYVINNNPHQRVQDLHQVVNYVLQTKQYKKIVVIGASEGALVGEMFTFENPQVTALISLVGGANYLLDDIRYNMSQTIPPDELAQQQADFEAFMNQILNAKEPIDMGEGNELGFKWFQSILSVSRYDFLSKIKQPVLLIDCARDNNTSPIESDKLYQRLKNDNKKNITQFVYPELDHYFTNTSGKRELEQVIFDSQNWLNISLAKSLP